MHCDANWDDAEWNSFSPYRMGCLTGQMSSTMPWLLCLSALMSMAVPASPAFAEHDRLSTLRPSYSTDSSPLLLRRGLSSLTITPAMMKAAPRIASGRACRPRSGR